MQYKPNKSNNSTENLSDKDGSVNSGEHGKADNPAGNPVAQQSIDMVNQGSTPTQGGGDQVINENKVAGDKTY